MENLFLLRMEIKNMCEDYKKFDISIINRKCDTKELNCPYFENDWEDYSWEDADGITNWESYEQCYCYFQKIADENAKCPLFGFSKNDEVNVKYSYG